MNRAARRFAFHEVMSLLGVGDLHPGGGSTSEFLLGEITRSGARRVLEVGAGIGATTGRMRAAGLEVTPLEPNTVMRRILERRLHVPVVATPFEAFEAPAASYDAVLGEGVFYALDAVASAAKLHRLLKPGGLLATADTLWTTGAVPEVASFVHEQTKEVFGIPMAPRDAASAKRWADALRNAGFVETRTRAIDTAVDDARLARRARIAWGLLRRPDLVPLFLEYRLYRGLRWAPPGWLESRATVWRRDPAP